MSEVDASKPAAVVTAPQAVSIAVRFLIYLAMVPALLFGPAGRWDIRAFWIYCGLLMGYSVVALVFALRNDPTLVFEPLRPGPGGKDPHLRLFGVVLFALHLCVAGLDVGRFHWSDSVPAGLQVGGLIGLGVALTILQWAMRVNHFFSSDARIQRDRGHYVVTGGPYQFIRHPGYLCNIVLTLSSPLALGSYVSALGVLPFIPLLLRRMRIEEGLLLAELEGYAKYAQRVRYRLVPGLW
jgi:protein-S-isoprenylcysteine O-methyltransferase Ste14